MKKVIVLLAGLLLLTGCATTQLKYEPHSFTPIPKVEAYKLPEDPFKEPPVPVYLKKDTSGKYITCQKEEAELVAYTGKELNKIVLRLEYLKTVNADLEKLVNIHIQRENVLIDIVTDQNTAKEIYREILVDLQNQIKGQKIDQAGQWVIIIGQLIAIIGLAF